MPDSTKTRLGHYELLEVLGDGAEGRVYKARCLTDRVPGVKFGDLVAVKRLRSTGFDRFQHQVEILRSLNHPNIVRYLDSFELHQQDMDEEGYCIVTELLVGETLKERLERNRTGLPWPVARKIMSDTLNALLFSTSKRVVHRDIKTSNIYVIGESESKLIDFGIARVEDTGASTVAGFKGTFDYMAPDFVTFQVEGGFRGDEQSDIFSFGVIFYEVLTGELPCEKLKGNVEIEHVKRWMDKQRPPRVKYNHPVFDVLIGARACLRRCLDVNRATRYQTFQELQADFSGIRPKKLVDHNDVYEYSNYLGKGGFGKVYHARRVSDGKDVAIKELLADHQTRRFEKEARILKSVPHPGLVAYLGFVEIKDEDLGSMRKFSLILEYLEGMPANSLRDRIKATAAGLDPKEVLPIFIVYLNCLDYLHKKGIIHRDIKPANLYAPPGQPEKAKIFDLGIAHDAEGTRTHGQVPGTLDYMPPEFANPDLMKDQEGGRGSPQSDLFSLGVTLYQALTRQLPFERFPTEEGAAWGAFYLRAEQPQECSLKHPVFVQYPALVRVVRRCLAHEPRQRYSSAHEMAAELQQILREIGIRMLECGGRIYRLGDRLAKETYLASQEGDGAIVLIKKLTASSSQWRRFKSDARILKEHPHNHLVAYICFDEDKGQSTPEISQFHLILEYLKDLPQANLRQRIKDSPAGLEPKEVLPLFLGYLEGLDHLHRFGIFHGGITAAHLYAPAGEPEKAKILDLAFGHEGEALRAHPPAAETLDYLPPEFASPEGGRDSAQADLYSLGVALHLALTGQLPFDPIPGGTAAAWTAFTLRVEKPRRCSLNHPVFARLPGLAEVLRRCLAHQPSQRYVSAQAMMEDLAIILRDIDLRMIQCDGEMYVFGECLGRSAAGATHRAARRSDGLPVIVKEFNAGSRHMDRFVDEAQMLRERPHPNLVKYIGLVEEEQAGPEGEESRCYLIQEFLEGLPGASLRERLRHAKSGLDADEVLSLFNGYLLGLEHLHGKRIFHRDIKPDHLYAPVGEPQMGKAFDLGVSLGARETPTLEPKPGTLAYMAPELFAAGARYSQQADIFSLGVSLYEALTGQAPFPQSSEGLPPQAAWSNLSFTHPVFANARGRSLAEVVRRATAFDPQARYVSAGAMRKDLAAAPPPPQLALKLVERIPAGPVAAGSQQFWGLAVEYVGSHDLGSLSVTTTSRSPNLVPQENIQANIEADRINIAALPLRTAVGPAIIEVSIRARSLCSDPLSLTMEIEAIPPALLLDSSFPEGPVRAGREKIWFLSVSEVAASEMASLIITATSRSPELLPQANIQAQVEAGKIKISAQPLRTALGEAAIEVSVRNGLATSQPMILAMEVEAIPPWLTFQRAIPEGPVKAGSEQIWVLTVVGVPPEEMKFLSITAVSRTPELVPQDNLAVKVEGGKVQVSAHSAKAVSGSAVIEVSFRNRTIQGEPISLTMVIEPIPPPRVQLLTPTPLRLAPTEDSLRLDFEVADDDMPPKALSFSCKVDPPDLVTFDAPGASATPKRSLRLHRVRSRNGRGGIDVVVEAEGRRTSSRFEFEVARAPRPKWPFMVGVLLLVMAAMGAYFYFKPSHAVSTVEIAATPGKAPIHATEVIPPSNKAVTPEPRPPTSTITLLTPDALHLRANQDSSELKFSVGDQDPNLTPEDLTFDARSVDPANSVILKPPTMLGGASRSLTLLRGPGYPDHPATIIVRVSVGSRSSSQEFTLQVDPKPAFILPPEGKIVIEHDQPGTNVPVVISDPYTPSDKLMPTFTVEPPDLLALELSQISGSNWSLHLARKTGVPTATDGKVTIKLQGRGEPVTSSFSVKLEPEASASLSSSLVKFPVRKRTDGPLRVPLRLAGSDCQIKHAHSDNPALLPDGGIKLDTHRDSNGNGAIILAPRPGLRGQAHVELNITAMDAKEVPIKFDLVLDGEIPPPALVVLPYQTNLDKAGTTELQIRLNSDYDELTNLVASQPQMVPPGSLAVKDFPPVLTSNFSFTVTALEEGTANMILKVSDPNQQSVTSNIKFHVLPSFGISGPSNLLLTFGAATNRLLLADDSNDLDKMSESDIQVTSSKLFSTSPSMKKLKGSNALDLIISPAGQLGGHDTLKVTVTDSSGRKASAHIFVRYVPPFTSSLEVPPNALRMSFVWVPGLPGTEQSTWSLPETGEPLAGGGWVAQYKVTQEQFKSVLGINPSLYINNRQRREPNRPVESMSFEQASNFCAQLTARDRNANKIPSGWQYALPSVQQWAFYAAGTSPEQAHISDSHNPDGPNSVDKSPANPRGLYEVLGDLFELTRQPHQHTEEGKVFEGYVRRGGAFATPFRDVLNTAADAPFDEENWWYPGNAKQLELAGPKTGFRVILVPEEAAK